MSVDLRPNRTTIKGIWQYDPVSEGLFPESHTDYLITLDRIRTVDQVGVWVLHLSRKTWITSTDIGDFVLAARHMTGVDA